jgi:cytochrome c
MRRNLLAVLAFGALAIAACSPPAQQAETTPAPVESTPAPETEMPSNPEAVLIELAIQDANGATLSGDPERGERVFAQCQSCHTVDAGVNRTGPSLHAIVGRTAGSVEGFRYSDANRNSGITWSEQELFNYLENPRVRIPGTTMAFAGIRNAQQRADLIAYLKHESDE